MSNPKLVNAVTVFVAPDAQKKADYYQDVLVF